MAQVTLIAHTAKWAVGTDQVQWILMRWLGHPRNPWKHLSFVSSSRDILARVMRERGVPETDRDALLSALPERFAQGGQSSGDHTTLQAT
jgi:hypothetical protein